MQLTCLLSSFLASLHSYVLLACYLTTVVAAFFQSACKFSCFLSCIHSCNLLAWFPALLHTRMLTIGHLVPVCILLACYFVSLVVNISPIFCSFLACCVCLNPRFLDCSHTYNMLSCLLHFSPFCRPLVLLSLTICKQYSNLLTWFLLYFLLASLVFACMLSHFHSRNIRSFFCFITFKSLCNILASLRLACWLFATIMQKFLAFLATSILEHYLHTCKQINCKNVHNQWLPKTSKQESRKVGQQLSMCTIAGKLATTEVRKQELRRNSGL